MFIFFATRVVDLDPIKAMSIVNKHFEQFEWLSWWY